MPISFARSNAEKGPFEGPLHPKFPGSETTKPESSCQAVLSPKISFPLQLIGGFYRIAFSPTFQTPLHVESVFLFNFSFYQPG